MFISASVSSLWLAPKNAPMSIYITTRILTIASTLHWLTWEHRYNKNHPFAYTAFMIDMTCMGLIPLFFVANVLWNSRWFASIISSTSLIYFALISTMNEFIFYCAVEFLIILTVIVFVIEYGFCKCFWSISFIMLGTACKFNMSLERGTTLFHILFGYAIQEAVYLIQNQN